MATASIDCKAESALRGESGVVLLEDEAAAIGRERRPLVGLSSDDGIELGPLERLLFGFSLLFLQQRPVLVRRTDVVWRLRHGGRARRQLRRWRRDW